MKRTLFALAAISILTPASAFATSTSSTFLAARTLVISSSTPANTYAAGISVVLTGPVGGDLSAVGGSITSTAPVVGDTLFVGGSITARGPISGDARIIGGTIDIERPILGDLVAFGYSLTDTARVNGNVFVMAADTILSGASGPVMVYGNNVALSGTFANNVTVFAGSHLSVAASTTIEGTLSYQAPSIADIPDSAIIRGGVTYTNASYLPNPGDSRSLALVSILVFLFARILGALILAGLFAGLFPRLSGAVAEYAHTKRIGDITLTMLLGFAALVATPILCLLLMLTFIGFGIALVLLIAYLLIVLLAIIHAGILIGSMIARRFEHRTNIRWRDGVLGMLILSFITLIPFIGFITIVLFTIFATGALLILFSRNAFPRQSHSLRE